MAEKVTVMVLKVDLQCPCCYKKVKKILCKFPQIRDQVYDEKGNRVTITVVCCNPEKLRDKLCCKGGKVIQSIEIKEPEKKPKEPEKPKDVVIEKPKVPEKPKVVVIEKPKEPEKPKVVVIEKPKEPEKPKIVVVEKPKEPEKPKIVVVDKPKEPEKPKVVLEKPKEPAPPKIPKPSPDPPRGPHHGFPSIFPYPYEPCCRPCFEGYDWGPCNHGPRYGVPTPPPPQPCYDGYGYGYGRGCQLSRCDYYFSEENPSSCSIM